MANKYLTQRKRAISLNKLKGHLQAIYRDDLAGQLAAKTTPTEEKFPATGEWQEETPVTGKPGKLGRHYVYVRYSDGQCRERHIKQRALLGTI